MNLKETYNKIAKDWHGDHQKDSRWVKGANTFLSFLQKGDSVLDVGCGPGITSKYFTGKGLRVTGIDFSEKMLEIAKQEVPSGEFLVLDLKDADMLEDLFEGIFMQAVLLHIPKKDVAEHLRKLTGRLKEGGYLSIAVKEKKPDGVEEEIKTENDYGYSYERFFSYYTVEEIESHMRTLGLTIVFSEVRPSGKTNWVEVIGKKE
ncbi:MAG: class I SAM-dependent methyltransferase [Candidatus Yanofskybacteria bacterium]|nr:class I SAM-dependent methyltransferase [Candidatus Yanofskybacteria bacterium]